MRLWVWILGAALGAGCGPPIPEEEPPDAAGTLWPSTQGSFWRYRIDDPVRGSFEKRVTVEGPAKVPGTDRDAVLFKSVQPYLEERSYEVEADGVVKRAYEEDYKGGALARVTAWAPEITKMLSASRPVGFELHEVITETVTEAGATTQTQKQYTWRVLAIDVPWTVAGKTVKTVQIQRDRPDKVGKERRYWLAPGIGKVHEEGERTEDLVEYDVK